MRKASFCSSGALPHSLIFPHAPLTPSAQLGTRRFSQSVRFQSWPRSQFLTESQGFLPLRQAQQLLVFSAHLSWGTRWRTVLPGPRGSHPWRETALREVAFLGKGLQGSRKDQPRRQMEGGAASQGLPGRLALSSTIHQSRPWYFL